MRILIVSSLSGQWLRLFDGEVHEFRVCTAQSQILAAMDAFKPQLVVLDEAVIGGEVSPADTLAEIRRLSEPLTYLVSITQQSSINELCHRMVADALLHPGDGPDQMKLLLEARTNRKPFLSLSLLTRMECPATQLESLSKCEKLVLDMIWAGKSCQQIADHFGRSLDTAKNHRKAVKRKLGLYGSKDELLNFEKLYEIVSRVSMVQ